MTEENREKLKITLNIHNITLKPTIFRDEEELYRRAATMSNEVINVYSKIYNSYKDTQEILTMALFDIALRNEKAGKRNDTAPLYDILTKITSEIESTIKPKQKE